MTDDTLTHEFDYAGREILITIEPDHTGKFYDVTSVMYLEGDMPDFADVEYPALRQSLIQHAKPELDKIWDLFCFNNPEYGPKEKSDREEHGTYW